MRRMINLALVFAFSIFAFTANIAAQKIPGRKKSKPIICSDCFPLRGVPIVLPKPEYPKAAKAVGASGTVSVLITINEKGDVIKAEVKSGHPLLWAESVKAALGSKWKPTVLYDKPIVVTGVLTFNYISDISDENKNRISAEAFQAKAIPDLGAGKIVGKAIKLPKPPFPNNCKCKFSKQLTTVLNFVVDEKGNVESAVAIAGHPALRAASAVAIRNSQFSISAINGNPVKAFGTIIYKFVRLKNGFSARVSKVELKPER